jgi:very-short-patch-repair endonuclease
VNCVHLPWRAVPGTSLPRPKSNYGHTYASCDDGIHFRRQHAIGLYITDFCSPKAKLIIELDGSQHLEQEEYDTERTALLESKGYRVLRFWNSDVMNNIEGVVGVILEELSPAGILTKEERK